MAASKASFNVTEYNCHYFKFSWPIQNFSSCPTELLSPTFSLAQNCSSSWRIAMEVSYPIHPKRISYDSYTNVWPSQKAPVVDLNKVRIGFERTDSKPCKANISCFFEFCDYAGTIHHTVSKNFSFSQKEEKHFTNVKSSDDIHYPSGVPSSSFSLINDNFIIKGNIVVHQCCQKKKLVTELLNENLSQLQCDFKAYLSNQQFTDVVLKVGSDVIHAHKFVLCARSPVFRKMFEQNMIESKQSTVNIDDIQKSTLEGFLAFLYTGIIEDRQFTTVIALYSAADKYEVKTLQKTCSDILISYISVNTVTQILKLADMHNDDKLKEISVKFICDNFSEIETSTEWGKLLDSDPHLASYTLRRVSASIKKR